MLHKGEREAGTIVVLTTERGGNARVYERMPSPEGGRVWVESRKQSIENANEISEYLDRRKAQDDDLWIVELDIANGERFIGLN